MPVRYQLSSFSVQTLTYQVLIIYYLIFVMAISIAISYALSVLFEVGNGDVSKLENTRMHLS